jgi:PAS domain S-box-containing protein
MSQVIPSRRSIAPLPLTLESILESIQDVFYRVDDEGRIEALSRSGALELGFDSPEDLIGTSVSARWVHPERRPAMLAALRRDGAVRDWEAELRRKDGGSLTVATTVHLLVDGDGRERGYEGIWRNISDRKRTEERVRQSEEKFAQIFRTVPDTLVVSRAQDGLLLDVNPGFEAATGYSREEALGNSTIGLHLWADEDARVRMVKDLRRGGEVPERELTFRRKDGALRTGVFSARTLSIHGEPCVLFLMRDVTEPRRAEAMARLQDQRLAQAVEGANLGTWDWDPRDDTTHINARWAGMLGYAVEEVPNPMAHWRASIHPDDQERVGSALGDCLAGGSPLYEAEHRLRHRDGRWIWVLTTGRVVARDEGGLPTRVCGTHLDVSERKRLEAERANLEEQLRQAQKLDAVGQVAGGVAHDFNNMLTVQLGALEELKQLPGLPAEARALAAEIEEGARSAAALTRQLLAFSRRQVIRPARVDLDELVADFLGMLRRVLRENVSLELHRSPSPLWVDVDVGMTQQVLMNLAVNARDAMPSGGRLSLSCDTLEVTAPERIPGNDPGVGRYVRLSVADTGHGMDDATLRRLCEPFFTTKPMGSGTGLGLATVYGIVKQHRGWMEVDSRVGEGTTFRVHWPEAAGGTKAPRPAEPSRATGGGGRVLLVEDDAGVRRVLESWLRRFGYEVLACEDGPAALARWKEVGGRVDAVVTDMLLPGGLSGRDVLERLRRDAPGLAAVVMSGYSAELVEGGIPPGAGFVQKPCEPRALASALREQMDLRRVPAS